MRRTALLVITQLICACTAACQQDSVQPGFTWPRDEAGASGQPQAGAAAARTGGVAGSRTNGDPGTKAIDRETAGMGSTALGAAGMAPADVGSAGAGMPMPAPSGEACDLSGRWIATLHFVTEALGQQQTAHFYTYYEIARDGDGYAITKGLHCGDDAASIGDLAVRADFSDAWPAGRIKISYADRTVTSTPSGNGCKVAFGRAYTVRGASVPHYLDPKNPLPTSEQPASGNTPGWEDWDGDGQPGITGLLSGPGATGRIFVAPRQWTELAGTVPNTVTRFRLPLDWDQEQNVMAYDPAWNLTLGTPSSRHPDDDLHFGEFVRLADDQALGDDSDAICGAIIELAPVLTPAASAI